MRVIAGEFRGRRLVTVKGLETRPILDRMKESLFGMLADTVIGARVLDLFCGGGTIAIEALSQGAASAVLVDISRGARLAAERNIQLLGLGSRVEFLGLDAARAVRKLAARGARFDLVFVDPPYFREFAPRVLAAIREGGILDLDGRAVVRHHKKENLVEQVPGWRTERQRQVGEAVFTFLTLPDRGPRTTIEEQDADCGA